MIGLVCMRIGAAICLFAPMIFVDMKDSGFFFVGFTVLWGSSEIVQAIIKNKP